MVYVYAFAAAPASLPAIAGIDGAPLASERTGAIDAVVSVHDEAPQSSDAAILAHAAVVEALATTNDAVLPARFGSTHDDAAALGAAVADRAAGLQAALDRVRGCVELGVRVLAAEAEPVVAATGADYMQARLARRRETEGLADAVDGPLSGLAREAKRTVGATDRLLLSASYLVPRESVEEFSALVVGLQAKHPGISLVATGPWPPYSFTTAEAGS